MDRPLRGLSEVSGQGRVDAADRAVDFGDRLFFGYVGSPSPAGGRDVVAALGESRASLTGSSLRKPTPNVRLSRG